MNKRITRPSASLPDSRRRSCLRGAALGVGAAIASPGSIGGVPAAPSARRTFVLVHGAWHGAWCWRRVADLLEANGHKVYTPTLTGLADRSHLLSTSITLQTHIDDIVNLFKWEDLSNVILVAHSYGGWPVSGALEKIGSQVASVVFVDAFLPESGQRVIDTNAPQFQEALLDAIKRGEAGRPVPSASQFKVLRPEDAAWVQSKMTPQPTGVSVTPIQLNGARDRVSKKLYLRAVGFPNPQFDKYFEACKASKGWQALSLSADVCGHDVMVDAPDRLADLLCQST